MKYSTITQHNNVINYNQLTCVYLAPTRWNDSYNWTLPQTMMQLFFFYPYISKYITIILYLSITLGILFFSLHSEKTWQMGINSQVIYLFLGRDIVIYEGCSLLFSFSTKSKRKNFITSTSLFFGRSRTNYCYIFLKLHFKKSLFFIGGLKVNFLNLIFISIKIWTQYFKPTSIHNYIISWFTVDDLICCNLFS